MAETGEGTAVSAADRAHAELRELLLRFALLPKQKLNEVALAERLNTSRTPLREALNRLVAEGLLEKGTRGFSVPDLRVDVVTDLFEARLELECAIVRLACERATEAGLEALAGFLDESIAETPDASVDRLIELDIGFHDTLARLAGNAVMRGMLANLNDRIHLVRWIAMDGRRAGTQSQHRDILARVRARDAAGAMALMREHILHRNDEIVAAIRAAYGHVHMLGAG
ncbi:MAG: GntR family transcriptional regulator [Rhodobacteraceae bacterium]|nr:GntR family transcriptional regulator [Paracoccaceae bacterium]